MSEYPLGSVADREMLAKMPIEKLLDFFFLQIRNLWRVDGLYFLGIEKKFGTEAATEIDAGVWESAHQMHILKIYGANGNLDSDFFGADCSPSNPALPRWIKSQIIHAIFRAFTLKYGEIDENRFLN